MRAAVVAAVAWAAIAIARPAAAQALPPAAPHVIHVPTAWVLAQGGAWGSAGVDHRGGGYLDVVASLGGLAEVDAGTDDAFVTCACANGRVLTAAWLPVAGVKLGVARGGPGRRVGVAIGARRSFADRADVAAIYVVASTELGTLRAHGGAIVWDAASGGVRMAAGRAPPLRPLGGLEWTPPAYPRTTVLGDLSWLPELEPAGARIRWIAGWGVRYQALSWGSIELTVRHREGDELGASTVMVRVNGVLAR